MGHSEDKGRRDSRGRGRGKAWRDAPGVARGLSNAEVSWSRKAGKGV